MENNLWEMVLWDRSTIQVRPQNVEAIKQKIATGDGHIITKTRTINVKDIKEFRVTDKVHREVLAIDSGLEEGAARAFKEPLHNSEGDVRAKYVKKYVPRNSYESFYSKSPSYFKVTDESDGVWVGFVLPVHLIDDQVSEMSPAEIQKIRD